MKIGSKTLQTTLVLASGSLFGCDWFAEPPCKAGQESCDGDTIRVCTPKPSSSAGSGNATQYDWSTVMSCDADAERGALTCGLSHGRAQCVPVRFESGADGGVMSEARWVRVLVVRDGDEFSFGAFDEQVLSAEMRPMGASSGSVAAVSYAGEKPIDATLVRFADRAVLGAAGEGARNVVPVRGVEQVVWLRAQGADRIKLVTPKGAVLAEEPLSMSVTKASRALIGGHAHALSAGLPPTLRVLEPRDIALIPDAVRSQMGALVTPTADMLTLVTTAFARAPGLAAAAATDLGFVAFGHQKADAASGGGGAPEAVGVDDLDRPSTALVGTTLLVNVSDGWLAVYRDKPQELARGLLHQLAFAYAGLATAPTALAAAPGDYPKEVGPLLQRRVSRMLAPNEGLREAWGAIHKVGVDANLAGQYLGASWAQRDDKEATHDGFFSPRGGFDPESDFAETVQRLHVPELWLGRSPCDALSASSLDELDPRLMVPLAKVELVTALGLVSEEVRVRCVGTLAEDATPGVMLHPPAGMPMAFDSGVQATLQPYLHGEMHLTMLGVRKATTALIDVSYRGTGIGVHRLLAVPARPDPEIGAGMYLANPHEYDSTFSVEGLLIVTRLDRERVTARGLLVRQKKEMLGETIWPLVTVRIDHPEWIEGL